MAPYDRFVPKIENETEGTQFWSSIRYPMENDLHGAFEAWGGGGGDGIAVYVSKETILKEMAVTIQWVKAEFLFWPSLGTSYMMLYPRK
jgi:hypothetical protein